MRRMRLSLVLSLSGKPFALFPSSARAGAVSSLKRLLHDGVRIRRVPTPQDQLQQPPKKDISRQDHVIGWEDLKAKYADTHCHLFSTLSMLRQKDGDETIPGDRIDTFVKTFFPKNCTAVIDIHCDLPLGAHHDDALVLEDWPENFKYYFAIGTHPHNATQYTDEVHENIVKIVSNPRCVAWGECGLDYFKNLTETHAVQREVFARQLVAAVSLKKPIVVHTRDAADDTLALLREHVPRDHNLHIHCFTSTSELARDILSEFPNSFIGLTGVVTYSGLEHVVELIVSGALPLERILLETDSPYLVPRNAYERVKGKPGWRGKKFLVSHSGMIPFVAEKVARWASTGRAQRGEKEVNIEEVLEITRDNAVRMYGIDI